MSRCRIIAEVYGRHWLYRAPKRHGQRFGDIAVVLANGSMPSTQSGEGEMRQTIIERDVIDCMIALPGQLFYSTQIPACLWFFARDKTNSIARNAKLRDMRGEVLFIDARKLGHLADRTRREFSDVDIAQIADTYHRWRQGKDYEDVPDFCKAASLDEVRRHCNVLTPGRCFGAEAAEEDGAPFTAARCWYERAIAEIAKGNMVAGE